MIAGGLALAARRRAATVCVMVVVCSSKVGEAERTGGFGFLSSAPLEDGAHGVEQPILLYVLHNSAALAKSLVLTHLIFRRPIVDLIRHAQFSVPRGFSSQRCPSPNPLHA
ncbi:unnamed protein product, partial [Ectocarpus fasciculatus]